MRPSIFTTTFSALTFAALAGCGAQGPAAPSEDAPPTSQGGNQGTGGDVASGDGGAATTGSGSGSGGSSDASSGAGSGGQGGADDDPPPTCSIMSSNVSCKSCLEKSCCMVVHACLDEDLLGCMACLDCTLSGEGPDCCDESVGKNDWLVECIAFNCQDAC